MSVLFPYDSGFLFNLQMFLQAGSTQAVVLDVFLGLEAHEALHGVVGWCQVIQSDGLALASIESPPLPGAGAKNPTKIRRGRGGWLGLRLQQNEEKKTLGGGFKCFLCSPRKLGKISNLTSIFFKWVGSTTN